MEREKLLKEINIAQEESLKINMENESLQASEASLQALTENSAVQQRYSNGRVSEVTGRKRSPGESYQEAGH